MLEAGVDYVLWAMGFVGLRNQAATSGKFAGYGGGQLRKRIYGQPAYPIGRLASVHHQFAGLHELRWRLLLRMSATQYTSPTDRNGHKPKEDSPPSQPSLLNAHWPMRRAVHASPVRCLQLRSQPILWSSGRAYGGLPGRVKKHAGGLASACSSCGVRSCLRSSLELDANASGAFSQATRRFPDDVISGTPLFPTGWSCLPLRRPACFAPGRRRGR
jgi:hypothetical protein